MARCPTANSSCHLSCRAQVIHTGGHTCRAALTRLQVTTVQQRQVFMPAQHMQASPSGPHLEGPHFAPPAHNNFLGMHNDAMQQTKQHRRQALHAWVMAALETAL